MLLLACERYRIPCTLTLEVSPTLRNRTCRQLGGQQDTHLYMTSQVSTRVVGGRKWSPPTRTIVFQHADVKRFTLGLSRSMICIKARRVAEPSDTIYRVITLLVKSDALALSVSTNLHMRVEL